MFLMAELQTLLHAAQEGEEALAGLSAASEALRTRLLLGADPVLCEQHALQLREASDRLLGALDASLAAGGTALRIGAPYATLALQLSQVLAALASVAVDASKRAYLQPPDPALFDGRDVFSLRCALAKHSP